MKEELKKEETNKKKGSIMDPIAGVIFTTIFLVAFNVFYDRISFLTEDFEQIRTLYNLSLIIGIGIQFSRIFFRNEVYRRGTDIINNIIFILIAYQLWIIFPFDTSVIGDPSVWDPIFRLLIIVPPILTILATIVIFVKMFLSWDE